MKLQYTIIKNGSLVSYARTITTVTTVAYHALISDCVFLAKGDTFNLKVSITANGTTSNLSSNPGVNYFSISKIG